MIDADIHHESVTVGDLLPWLDPGIRRYVETSNFGLPGALYPNPHHYVRRDAMVEPGDMDGALRLMREQLLDAYPVEYAVVNGGGHVMLLQCLANANVASELAAGWNRWLTEDWLPRDERLRGSMLVAPQDPIRAAPRSARCASGPGSSRSS